VLAVGGFRIAGRNASWLLHVRPSVWLSFIPHTYIRTVPTGRICMKFYVADLESKFG